MPVVHVNLHLPAALWHAVQALASEAGDANTVILRALEEYITASAQRQGCQSGEYRKLVQALSMPVADLHLSARPATVLRVMNIGYVYELVALESHALLRRKNLGEKSLREVKDKLAALGLALGTTLDDGSYRAAVVATVIASINAVTG